VGLFYSEYIIWPNQELHNGRVTNRALALGEFAAAVQLITESGTRSNRKRALDVRIRDPFIRDCFQMALQNPTPHTKWILECPRSNKRRYSPLIWQEFTTCSRLQIFRVWMMN